MWSALNPRKPNDNPSPNPISLSLTTGPEHPQAHPELSGILRDEGLCPRDQRGNSAWVALEHPRGVTARHSNFGPTTHTRSANPHRSPELTHVFTSCSDSRVEIVKRSPFEPHEQLMAMVNDANALGKSGVGAAKGTGAQKVLRKYGANMFIATEFKVEVREKPEPVVVAATYSGARMAELQPRFHALLDNKRSEVVCFFAFYPVMAGRRAAGANVSSSSYPSLDSKEDTFEVGCKYGEEPEAATKVQFLCNYIQDALGEPARMCVKSTSHFAVLTEHEGFGWYPFFSGVFFPADVLTGPPPSNGTGIAVRENTQAALIGQVMQHLFELLRTSECRFTEGNSIMMVPTEVLPRTFMDQIGDTKGFKDKRDFIGGRWLFFDNWLNDDVERKEQCVTSTQQLQHQFTEYIDSLGLVQRAWDTHLPDCSKSRVGWRQRYYGNDYWVRHPSEHSCPGQMPSHQTQPEPSLLMHVSTTQPRS